MSLLGQSAEQFGVLVAELVNGGEERRRCGGPLPQEVNEVANGLPFFRGQGVDDGSEILLGHMCALIEV